MDTFVCVGTRAISQCTLEFGSGWSIIIKMWALWVHFGRCWGAVLVDLLSPKFAPVGDK